MSGGGWGAGRPGGGGRFAGPTVRNLLHETVPNICALSTFG